MLLQIDSTVLYPLTDGRYDVEKLTADDLELRSSYNTYVYTGLPVGPICNPGLACINAAINPEETNYLYYYMVDEETGKHEFSETYEEHQSVIMGGSDRDGDGIADYDVDSNVYQDNNAESDIWSNQNGDD